MTDKKELKSQFTQLNINAWSNKGHSVKLIEDHDQLNFVYDIE